MISIGDNSLRSYEVNHCERTIILRTEDPHSVPVERVNATFFGWHAYEFINDAFPLGTILLGIDEYDPLRLFHKNRESFLKQLRYGWPGSWARSEAEAAEYFAKEGIKAFDISASCGLCGWVLAQGLELSAVDQQAN